MKVIVRLTLAVISLCAFSSQVFAKTNTVSIMSYNVENLFDNIKDPGKSDYTYLPLEEKNNPEVQNFCRSQSEKSRIQECLETDWSDSVLSKKMSHIADTILQINGRGPDVMLLVEVENLNILQKLNREYLSAAGYTTEVLIEGDDQRGIDVAVLSRFPLAEPAALHRIDFTPETKNPNWKKPLTRGILEVPLRLPDGKTLYVYALHFPSQAKPLIQRQDAVRTLNKLNMSKPADALQIAGGDFNITKEENHSVGLFSQALSSQWDVSHLVGCKSCKGSHYYKGDWSFLDALLFSKSLAPTKSANHMYVVDSIRTPKSGKYQLGKDGNPQRFDPRGDRGVSDHLPMYGEITYNSK